MRPLITLLLVAAIGAGIIYAMNWGSNTAARPQADQSGLDFSQIGNNAAGQQNQSTQSSNQSGAPSMTIDTSKTYYAIMKTTAGEIDIQLDAKNTPVTANNFVSLAEKNFYDNTIFHRVIKGFMIQGGDPRGDGTGGPGYTFADEPIVGDYTRGTVAMANAGPNTNGSQFFIVQQNVKLQKNYVIFGHVLNGMDVVDKIADAPVEANASGEKSKPVNPVTVESVTIAEK